MKIVEKYRELVRNNAELFSASEWALCNLTWLLPDRFSDSDLAVEGFHALLGLLSLYHESILSSPPVPVPKSQQPVPWIFWLGAIQQVTACWHAAGSCHLPIEQPFCSAAEWCTVADSTSPAKLKLVPLSPMVNKKNLCSPLNFCLLIFAGRSLN